MKNHILSILAASAIISNFAAVAAGPPLLNAPVDVSGDFYDFANNIFTADKLGEFDPATARGTVQYQRNAWATAQAFDNMLAMLKPVAGNEFPGIEYAANPELPFSLEFVSPRTVLPRIALAQSTAQMDWSKLELVVFAKDAAKASGQICLPSDNELSPISISKSGAGWQLDRDPLAGKVAWTISAVEKP